MHIFLTGASGLVGGAFARAARRRGHTLTTVTGASTASVPGAKRQLRLDLLDEHALTAAILECFPDAIVNCAAISEPSQCDADPIRSHQINVALPATLARLSHHVSAKLVHLSSEQVFDGTAAPYSTGSATNPINLYGRQKLASEQAVHGSAADFAITLRAPLLTGNSPSGKRSLHERLLADWAARKTPAVFSDEIRQPCTAENLAEVMLELLERDDLRGVFHWAGAEPLSRAELARRIRDHFKLDEKSAPLRVVTRDEAPGLSANRQADLSLNLKPLAGLLKTPVESFDAQLDQLVLPPPVREWYFKQ